MKVSVLIPAYNSRHKLPRVLEVLEQQTYRDFEIVVCDDASTDGTWEYLQGLGLPRVRAVRNERNLNQPGAMRHLFEEARGDFIAMHHDHEFARADWLEKMLAIFERHPRVGMAVPAWDLVLKDGTLRPRQALREDEIFARANPLPGQEFIGVLATERATPVSAHGTVFRAEAVRAAGGYSDGWGLASDEDLYRRVAARYDVAYCPEPVVTVVWRSDERHRILGNFAGVYTLFEFRRDTARRFLRAPPTVRAWNVLRLSVMEVKTISVETLSAWSRGNEARIIDALHWNDAPRLPTGRRPLESLMMRAALTAWVSALRRTIPVGFSLGTLRRRLRRLT